MAGIPGTSAAPTTAAPGGGLMGLAGTGIPEGKYTETIYTLIRDGQYTDAIQWLTLELGNFPRSRAALSLMGYCYYYLQDFRSAAQTYEQLVKFFPEVEDYKVYYAQSLYKAGIYDEAGKAALRVGSDQYVSRLLMLRSAILYEQNNLDGCKELLAHDAVGHTPETLINRACITFKEGNFQGALEQFQEAQEQVGKSADILYNIALCYYQMQNHGNALHAIAEIAEKGVREHPELSVGSAAEGVQVMSVGNTPVLRETALIEAFNLKAAVEFSMDNMEEAKAAIAEMPPRGEGELDPVTLHNSALLAMDSDPSAGFRKLNFLLANPPFPAETFANLILLYIKHEYYDLAADVMAQNTQLTFQFLEHGLYEFLEAALMVPTSPADAYQRFEQLSIRHVEDLRKHTKEIQDARDHGTDSLKQTLKAYDESLEKYIPCLMNMAKIYWDRENYPEVEKIFRLSAEFCGEHPVWKLNVAHVFFMQQEEKFKEAIEFYQPIVDEKRGHILDVTAIVLANLCVAYIMTSQNEAAERLMREIEAAEKLAVEAEPTKQVFHLCIVNLVIGTLYCSKGNYEFGVSRVMRSLAPFERKLGTDTWYYAKRCFLGLGETVAKHMVVLKDSTYHEIFEFLDACDRHGKDILTQVEQQATVTASPDAVDGVEPDEAGEGAAAAAVGGPAQEQQKQHSVSYEARLLKKLYLRLKQQ